MRRFAVFACALAVLLFMAAPALAEAPEVTTSDRVLVSINGDVALPAAEEAAFVLVIDGNATVDGKVNNLVVIRGTATLTGAQVRSITLIDSTANLQAGTQVTNEVYQLNSTVNQAEGVTVANGVRSMGEFLAAFAVFLGFAAIAFWIGTALWTLVAGLALAGLAARQVRTTEAIISHEPIKAVLIGLAMLIVPPLIMFGLAVTIVGLPVALSILLFVWPTLWFVGYLVASIWIGDWILRVAGRPQAERPYLAALIGLLVTGIAGFIPLVTAIVSLFGLGALTIAGWRTLVSRTAAPLLQPTPQPMGA
jgi:hypothetical protein